MFPSGMTKWQPLPMTLHSRYFSLNNSYLAQGFEFVSEPTGQFVIPVEKAMFVQMMSKAKVRSGSCNGMTLRWWYS